MSAPYDNDLRRELSSTLLNICRQLDVGASIDCVVITRRAESSLPPDRCTVTVDDGMRRIEISCVMAHIA